MAAHSGSPRHAASVRRGRKASHAPRSGAATSGTSDGPRARSVSSAGPGAFVSQRHIFRRERIVIGNDDELAIEFLGGLDLSSIEPRAAEIIRGEIAAVAARGQ